MSSQQPIHLLLVEDDPDTAMLITETLEDHFGAGCVRHCATLAQTADVDLATIDMVLSDMNLPDGTGLDLISKLLLHRPDLPVVMVTGEGVADNAINAIRRGAYDYVVKAGDYLFAIPIIIEKNLAIWRTKRENLRLQEELTRTLEEVRVKNRQLEEVVKQLEEAAATDPLTGLANRRAFNIALDRCFAEASRYGHDLACIMIDLDGFKQCNDTLGHQRGDELLQLVARVLEANSRRSDVAGRFGGDEFIVLLPQTDLPTARLVARRIAEEFNAAVQRAFAPMYRNAHQITLSMGLACLRHSRPVNTDQLIAHADHALYSAKQMGKARLVVFSQTPASDPTAPTPAPGSAAPGSATGNTPGKAGPVAGYSAAQRAVR